MRTHNLSTICKMLYCEQKLLLDLRIGDKSSPAVRAYQASGNAAHSVFEEKNIAAQNQPQVDKRCYVATHVFGGEAWQTRQLRLWRDRALLEHRIGKYFVRTYYVISPVLIAFFPRNGVVASWTKAALQTLLNRGWFKP